MQLSELLTHFRGVKPLSGNNHYIALCPCHNDHEPSLDIRTGDKGIVMSCPVCGADGKRVMQALNLSVKELFYEQISTSQQERPANVDYFYSDRLKKTRFYVWNRQKKMWKKSFCWYHRTDNGQWVKGLLKDENGKNITLPLYCEDLLKTARERSEPVYIVEGEKDADTLHKLGMPAVCSPHGAGNGNLENKWLLEYSVRFDGIDAVILPDNDEAGQNLAQYIAAQIFPHAKSVKLLNLKEEWTDLKEKGDITDIVESTNRADTKARLLRLAEHTAKWLPPKEKTPYICLSDVDSTKTEWLWRPYIPLGKITLLTADPGAGKTFLSLYLTAQVSTGRPFYGETNYREPAVAVYQTAEDGIADTIKPRLEPMRPRFENIFVYDEESESLCLSDGKIESIMRDLHPKLIIFDPLQAYLGADVDMHRANEVRPVLGRIGHLAEKYQCAVIFVMHHSKMTQNAALHRALGSIDIPAVARSMLVLGRDPDNPNGIILCHEKSSLAARGESIRFEIAPHLGGIVFNGYSELNADDILNLRMESRKKPSAKLDAVCDDILQLFGEQDYIQIESINDLCEQLECSRNTLYRARDELQIQSVTKGFGKSRSTFWIMPDVDKNTIPVLNQTAVADNDLPSSFPSVP